MNRTLISMSAILAIAIGTGCGDGLSVPDPVLSLGRFEAEIGGSLSESLEGSATSDRGFSARSDRSVWVLDLDDDTDQIFLALGVDTVPPPDSYPIAPPPAFDDEDILEDGAGWLFVEIVPEDGTEELFFSESGTLVIEASSPSDIYGRLSFETAPSATGSFGPLTGSGEFRADATLRIDLDARADF